MECDDDGGEEEEMIFDSQHKQQQMNNKFNIAPNSPKHFDKRRMADPNPYKHMTRVLWRGRWGTRRGKFD